MRVTFVLPHAGMAGGIRVLAIYAGRLHQRGHDVTVVSIPQARRSSLGKASRATRLSAQGSRCFSGGSLLGVLA